jgi:hypothetical protein
MKSDSSFEQCRVPSKSHALAPQRLTIVETSSLAPPKRLVRSAPGTASRALQCLPPELRLDFLCGSKMLDTTGKLSEGVAQCGATSFYSRAVGESTKATSFRRPALARAVLQSWQPARPPKQRGRQQHGVSSWLVSALQRLLSTRPVCGFDRHCRIPLYATKHPLFRGDLRSVHRARAGSGDVYPRAPPQRAPPTCLRRRRPDPPPRPSNQGVRNKRCMPSSIPRFPFPGYWGAHKRPQRVGPRG